MIPKVNEWQAIVEELLVQEKGQCDVLQVFYDKSPSSWATKKVVEDELHSVTTRLAANRTEVALHVHELKPKYLVLHIGFSSMLVVEMLREIRPDLIIVLVVRSLRELSVDPVHRTDLVFDLIAAAAKDPNLYLCWEDIHETYRWLLRAPDGVVFGGEDPTHLPPVPGLLVAPNTVRTGRSGVMLATKVQPYHNIADTFRAMHQHFGAIPDYHVFLLSSVVSARGRDYVAELKAFIQRYSSVAGIRTTIHDQLGRMEFHRFISQHIEHVVEPVQYDHAWSSTIQEAIGLLCRVYGTEMSEEGTTLREYRSPISYRETITHTLQLRRDFWSNFS